MAKVLQKIHKAPLERVVYIHLKGGKVRHGIVRKIMGIRVVSIKNNEGDFYPIHRSQDAIGWSELDKA